MSSLNFACFYDMGGLVPKDTETSQLAVTGTVAACLNGALGTGVYPDEKWTWSGNAWLLLGGDGQVDTRLSNVANQAAFTSLATAYAAVYPVADFSNRAMRIARPVFTHSTSFTIPDNNNLRLYIPEGAELQLTAPLIIGNSSYLVIEGESPASILDYSSTGYIQFSSVTSRLYLKNLSLTKIGAHNNFLFSPSATATATLDNVTLIPGPNANLVGNLGSPQNLVIRNSTVQSNALSTYVIATPSAPIVNNVIIQNLQVTGAMNGIWMQVDLSAATSTGGIYGLKSTAASGAGLTLILRASDIHYVTVPANDTLTANPTIDITDAKTPYITNIRTGNILIGDNGLDFTWNNIQLNTITVSPLATVTTFRMDNFELFVGPVVGASPGIINALWSNGTFGSGADLTGITNSSFANVVFGNITFPATWAEGQVTNFRAATLTIASSSGTFTNGSLSGTFNITGSYNRIQGLEAQTVGAQQVHGIGNTLSELYLPASTLVIGTNGGGATDGQSTTVSSSVLSSVTVYANTVSLIGNQVLSGGSTLDILGQTALLSGNTIQNFVQVTPAVHPAQITITGNKITLGLGITGDNTTDVAVIDSNFIGPNVALTNLVDVDGIVNSVFNGNYVQGNVLFVNGARNSAFGNCVSTFTLNMGVAVNSAAVGNRASAVTADNTSANFA